MIYAYGGGAESGQFYVILKYTHIYQQMKPHDDWIMECVMLLDNGVYNGVYDGVYNAIG